MSVCPFMAWAWCPSHCLPALHISHPQVKSEKINSCCPTCSDSDLEQLLKAGTSISAGPLDPPREAGRRQQQARQSFDGIARAASHGSTEFAPCAKYRLAQVWLPQGDSHAG